MSGYQSWVSKQRGNPIWLVVGSVGLISFAYLGYNKIWAPFMQRRKLSQAEIYANYIYEQEHKRGEH